MIFHMRNGRLAEKQTPEQAPFFNGPQIAGVISARWCYRQLELIFVSETYRKDAQLKTGWDEGVFECSLSVPGVFDGDLIWITNPQTQQREYYGDWILQ